MEINVSNMYIPWSVNQRLPDPRRHYLPIIKPFNGFLRVIAKYSLLIVIRSLHTYLGSYDMIHTYEIYQQTQNEKNLNNLKPIVNPVVWNLPESPILLIVLFAELGRYDTHVAALWLEPQ